MPKPQALPAKALDHMSDTAKAHVPANLLPPTTNVVQVIMPEEGGEFQYHATSGKDYFVFDFSQSGVLRASITGFDPADDKIVFENFATPEGDWILYPESGTIGGAGYTAISVEPEDSFARIQALVGTIYEGNWAEITLLDTVTTPQNLVNSLIVSPNDWFLS
ncbi:MAG: hypothetical protein V4656_06710 [Pseudomonadota bacterium]